MRLMKVGLRREFHHRGDLQRGRVRRRMKLYLAQTLVQAAKLERGEEGTHRFLVPRFEPKFDGIQLQLHIVEQMTELFVDAHLLGIFCNRFA
jgi:hypothetical protein